MSSKVNKQGPDAYKVTMEVKCDCEVGICDHAMEEVTKMLQAAYDSGVMDGVIKANTEFKKLLKQEFPNEFKEAERIVASQDKKIN